MNAESVDRSFWKRHLDKIGACGSLFAALCCLGFPALLAIVSVAGIGIAALIASSLLNVRFVARPAR